MGTLKLVALTGVALLALVSVVFGNQTERTVAAWGECTRPPVEPCFTHRGRLSGQNGIAHMVWLVGTKRVVAVDNGIPEFLLKYLDMASPEHSDIYGDYEICPLERDRSGYMRSVCVSSASRLVVQDRDRTRPPVRLVATWPKGKRREPTDTRPLKLP